MPAEDEFHPVAFVDMSDEISDWIRTYCFGSVFLALISAGRFSESLKWLNWSELSNFYTQQGLPLLFPLIKKYGIQFSSTVTVYGVSKNSRNGPTALDIGFGKVISDKPS